MTQLLTRLLCSFLPSQCSSLSTSQFPMLPHFTLVNFTRPMEDITIKFLVVLHAELSWIIREYSMLLNNLKLANNTAM